MRSVLHVSNTVAIFSTGENVPRYVPLNYQDVFIMATIGGAKGKVRVSCTYILEMIIIVQSNKVCLFI